MRTSIVVALAIVVLGLGLLARPVKAAPEGETTVSGGFSKRFQAGTVTATMPKAAPAKTVPAGIRVTAVEVGAD